MQKNKLLSCFDKYFSVLMTNDTTTDDDSILYIHPEHPAVFWDRLLANFECLYFLKEFDPLSEVHGQRKKNLSLAEKLKFMSWISSWAMGSPRLRSRDCVLIDYKSDVTWSLWLGDGDLILSPQVFCSSGPLLRLGVSGSLQLHLL